MATETRTSSRTNQTPVTTTRKGKDRLKVVRKTNARSNTVNTHTINADMDWMIIRNESDVDIKINFKNDVMTTDYFTLPVGESTAPIGVANGTDVNYQTVSGNSKSLALILWA